MQFAPSTKKIYLYNILSLGLYFFYWCARSRREIHASAQRSLIPSIWLLAIPAGNYWWMWQYAKALELVSYKRLKASDTFLLYIIGFHLPLAITWNFSQFTSDNNQNTRALLVFMLIWLAITVVLLSIGLAFFCASIQKRINRLRPAPAKPIS